MITNKVFSLIILYTLLIYTSLLFDSRLIIFEQLKLLSPYLFIVIILSCLLVKEFYSYFIFTAAIVVFLLMNNKFSFLDYAEAKTDNIKIAIDDKVLIRINDSDKCEIHSNSEVCSEEIKVIDNFFGSDLNCKIDGFYFKKTPIFIINRKNSLSADDIYFQKVCLRRLATFFKREKINGIVAGNFGTFSNATSVRLLTKTAKIYEPFLLENFIYKTFSFYPRGYVFLPNKISKFIFNYSGRENYSFDVNFS